jgi:tRNA threonylcarbamoyladenosine biosynthesis protein TsaE
MAKVLLQTQSTSETIRIGRQIGSRLLPGDVVALVGELGAGKTHLVKGLAGGVGVERHGCISSPSFTLIHQYSGRMPFYHIDLFRLETEREAEDLGLEECFASQGATAIEWADKIPSLLPKEMLWIHIQYTGTRTRSILILGKGKRYEGIVKEIVRSNESGIRGR